jgi:hypothetical protein
MKSETRPETRPEASKQKPEVATVPQVSATPATKQKGTDFVMKSSLEYVISLNGEDQVQKHDSVVRAVAHASRLKLAAPNMTVLITMTEVTECVLVDL